MSFSRRPSEALVDCQPGAPYGGAATLGHPDWLTERSSTATRNGQQTLYPFLIRGLSNSMLHSARVSNPLKFIEDLTMRVKAAEAYHLTSLAFSVHLSTEKLRGISFG